MEDLNDIFDPSDSAGDSADELDMELALSGEILQKMAQAEGIDLDTLSEGDIADLLAMVQGEKVAASHDSPNPLEHAEETKKASHNMSNELTVADVAAEMGKIAMAEGIDLSQVPREEYTEAFDKLAERMQDPTYFEMNEKLAEADAIGRHMAHSFVDELEKQSGAREMMYAAGSRAKGILGAAKGKLDDAATAVGTKARGGKEALTDRVRKSVAASGGTNSDHRKLVASLSKQDEELKSRSLGRRLLGGAAATGVAGTGGAAYAMNKKSFDESFEDDAVAFANSILVEGGHIEPMEISFSKFASYAGEEYVSAVEAHANELLAEAGWL